MSVSSSASSKCQLVLETGEETLDRLSRLDVGPLSAERTEIVTWAIATLETDSERYSINVQGCDKNAFHVLKAMIVTAEWAQLAHCKWDVGLPLGDEAETMRPHRD